MPALALAACFHSLSDVRLLFPAHPPVAARRVRWQPHVARRQLGICIKGTCLPHKPYWKNASYYTKKGLIVYGAPDEWMWRTELAQRNRKVQFPGLTRVNWPVDMSDCDHMDNKFGSPCAYRTKQDVIQECDRAQRKGYFFARKFGDDPKVVAALLGPHCMNRAFKETEFDLPNLEKLRRHPSDLDQTPEGASTRSEAMRLRGEPVWEGPVE